MAVPSALPLRRYLPSGEKDTVSTSAVWPIKRRSSCPVCTSHNRAEPSTLAVAMVLPSGENTAVKITSVWPISCVSSSPVCVSHTCTILLPPSARMYFPSGEKSILLISPSSLWYSRLNWPVAISQRRALPSVVLAEVKIVLPSGEKVARYTPSSSPNRRISFPVLASQSATPSLPADTIYLSSGENSTPFMKLVSPMNWRSSLPVCTSHSLIVVSQLPVTMYFPSCEKSAP